MINCLEQYGAISTDSVYVSEVTPSSTGSLYCHTNFAFNVLGLASKPACINPLFAVLAPEARSPLSTIQALTNMRTRSKCSTGL